MESKHINYKRTFYSFIFLSFWAVSQVFAQSVSLEVPPATTAPVAPEKAYGELFKQIQLEAIFPDSKTFVDCIPRVPAKEIMEQYEKQKDKKNFVLKTFVSKYFSLPPQPSSGYKSDTSLSIEAHINTLWPVLTRKPDEAGGSLIPLPKSYIVPGGRFGEVYYWDSYFTMLGLQVSGKTAMIQNMVDNFSHLIETQGFIPNGNRTYYKGRSQPPFYALMVGLLAKDKGDEVLKKYLPFLEKEYAFWMEGSSDLSESNVAHRRVVRMPDGSVLNRYWDDYAEPRPESYKEDYKLAQASGREAEQLYRDLRAACESGWDFSTRWLASGTDLSSIQTTKIIPIDLNCLLYNLEHTIARAAIVAGDENKTIQYLQKARLRKTSLMKYCFDIRKRYYIDYNFMEKKSTGIISMAGAYPLFFGITAQDEADRIAEILETKLLKDGGFLTTTTESGQQWDAPNGWAPLQWIAYAGLKKYGYDDLASEAAQRWISLNKKVYKKTGKMVEKYIVSGTEDEAGGGEYPLQDGFGWSNGVLLRLMKEEGMLKK
ncbi:alpha,alpha-trehalase TreF [Chondrinema litorale]|uniref:alpha,alpha-trehalase TreF n=1 Tax=Chondrinema litorale TaxID=2994555 RepID=UPI002542B315|nr:alpha,alpha-trehalase TreF [Chondrinema litorale]UZR94927.1 alpha,alpha-trehalase TreF [Chondrinema litorale]